MVKRRPTYLGRPVSPGLERVLAQARSLREREGPTTAPEQPESVEALVAGLGDASPALQRGAVARLVSLALDQPDTTPSWEVARRMAAAIRPVVWEAMPEEGPVEMGGGDAPRLLVAPEPRVACAVADALREIVRRGRPCEHVAGAVAPALEHLLEIAACVQGQTRVDVERAARRLQAVVSKAKERGGRIRAARIEQAVQLSRRLTRLERAMDRRAT